MDRGYDAMSIESVANAAGVGKSTVYRWWPSKAEVAVESFLEATKDELQLADTGDAREDFRQQILGLVTLLQGSRGRALAGMLGGARSDAELARALNERWLKPRRAWGGQRMARAIASGETRPGVRLGAALALLYSPVYTPLLFDDEVPTVAAMTEILDVALSSIFLTKA